MGDALQHNINFQIGLMGMRWDYRRLSATTLLLFFSFGAAGTFKEDKKMTQIPIQERKTHCLGRHLLDLPANATLDARYTVGDSKVETLHGLSERELKHMLAAREGELSTKQHDEMGRMLVDRKNISPDRVLITSWVSPNSRYLHKMELYSLFPEARVLQKIVGETSPEYFEKGVQYFSSLSQALRYRGAAEVPTEAGFCINFGVVMRSVLNKEETSATIRISGLPGLTFNYMAYVTGKPDRELLRRVASAPPAYEGTRSGMKMLRRGERNVGSIKGQELLVRGDASGKHSYEFLWESQGQRASLEHPFLSLRMTTTDESDENGEIMDAPFESDAEAMALWDSIIGSLRLRPGAVASANAKAR